MRRAVAATLLALLVAPARAAEPAAERACPDDAAARVELIRGNLRRTERWSRVWYDSWLAGFGTIALGSALLVPAFDDQRDRLVWSISAASAVVGVLFVAANWPAAISESERLSLAAARSTDVCALLVEAERALGRAADHQLANRKWYFHVLNVGYNLGVGLVIGLALNDWVNAVVNFGVGTALGEASILTLPMGSAKDRARYRRGQSIGLAPTGLRLAW
jgi:hypothetical protein